MIVLFLKIKHSLLFYCDLIDAVYRVKNSLIINIIIDKLYLLSVWDESDN